MVRTKKARRLLNQLMAQLDEAFMNQDLDRMTVTEMDESYDIWARQILCYENQLTPPPLVKSEIIMITQLQMDLITFILTVDTALLVYIAYHITPSKDKDK